jgi:Tol biopolymer transport system component/serine/threonine protein kinase
MIGRTLGHYRIDAKLGEGGMGVVYRARDTHLDRAVAIKVLAPGKAGDPGRKQRFVQEAKSASALNHPNIVAIYDIASDAGLDFIAMEFIDGKTLDEVIPSGGMRAPHALGYAAQIADALAKAHSAGIVHRDIKPSNVMVTPEGRVKILDFGLAKLMDDPAGHSPDAPTRTARPLTSEGLVLGTAAYMSPEQAEGQTIDARSDVFSFGSVLYEMVTGRKPFAGDSYLAVLTKILNEDPTPPANWAAIPPELDKIILRCLRKDRERRYQTMADLKVALEDLQEESGSGSVVLPATVPSRWRWTWALLLPVLLIVGLLAWRVWTAPERAEPLRAVALTTLPGAESYPSLSPDGNYVAFTWNGQKQDNPDVYVQMIGSSSVPIRLTTDARNDYNPVWSPDGRWIAFLRGPLARSELRLIPPLGGPERKLAEIEVRETFYVRPPYLTWCPDSTCLIVTDSTGDRRVDALFVVSLESGEKRQLTSPEPSTLGDTNPAVSPDGRSLVFLRVLSASTIELHWFALEKDVTAGNALRRLTLPAYARYPAWTADGKEILLSIGEVGGGLSRLAPSGTDPPARLPFVGEDGLMPAVSRPQSGGASRLVYVRSFNDENIWRLDTAALGSPSSSPPTVAISSTRADFSAQLSPDGRRVVFQSSRSGESEVWLADLDGSNASQLTFMDAPFSITPSWSPDGRWIAFASNPERQYEIYVISAEGGRPRRLTTNPAYDIIPTFSRDGQWIYFSSDRSGEPQVWKMPASGGDAVQVTHNGAYTAHESVDGAYLYYTQAIDAPSALWRVPTSGGQPVKLLEGVIQMAFAVLERGIYYLDQASGETRLQFFDFGTGRTTTVASNLGPVRRVLTATADGRTILYTRIDSSVNDLMLVEHFR